MNEQQTDNDHIVDQIAGLAQTVFTGRRWGLFGVLAPGYLYTALTLGIYRFWQVTAKRRYLWSHTIIDGDGLEYTGNAVQLLLGFLIALVFFLPLYGFFFFLSTQTPETATMGYVAAGVILFFLSGYAAFRARRFRLSRTLWRGIRFGQSGSAWNYAFRRFFWFILVAITAGLAYPQMTANLWRYRFDHTWFGDRQFRFDGSWRDIAWPFYGVYLIFVLIGGGLMYAIPLAEGEAGENAQGIVAILAIALFLMLGLVYFYLKSRFVTRLLSKVSVGRAKLKVRVRARSLFWQHLFYAILFLLITSVFAVIAGVLFSEFTGSIMAGKQVDLAEVFNLGWYNLAIFGGLYLLLLAAYAALSETILGLGYWKLVARDAVIENANDLKTVRASGEESPLAGEGLADALNVGAY